ncbi:MAG: heat-inducible transcription repressor HrcA [Chloroflexi bacterium]|nr:heat-inducible transcription repressor HrcA [Chloroflexota bacterium]
MLSARSGTILRFIVEHYIDRAAPVPSQYVALNAALKVSPATVRNAMAQMEQEGYLIRPHTSAGSIPSDRGYRYYVESLGHLQLPLAEQRLVSHLYHQVEREVEKWLRLTATLLAHLTRNMGVVTIPRPVSCKFKNMELVALQEKLVLAVVVLQGARVKQRLLSFSEALGQDALSAISNKLKAAYTGLTFKQIQDGALDLSPTEAQVRDLLVDIMRAEDSDEDYEEPFMDGWHLMLNQPEFHQGQRIGVLMEMVEHRKLLKAIMPKRLGNWGLYVIIGRENEAEAFHDYSVIVSPYGIPGEASGMVGVIGPTRMPYAQAISTVDYMASMLSQLMAGLYGKHY